MVLFLILGLERVRKDSTRLLYRAILFPAFCLPEAMLELTDSVEQYLIFEYAVDKNLSLVLLQDVKHVLYID